MRSTPWLRNFHEEHDETYRDFASIFILDEESSVSRKLASQEVKGKIQIQIVMIVQKMLST